MATATTSSRIRSASCQASGVEISTPQRSRQTEVMLFAVALTATLVQMVAMMSGVMEQCRPAASKLSRTLRKKSVSSPERS